MKRLFVGLRVESQVAERALQIVRKLKKMFDEKEVAIKWSRLDDLHITLVFIGETEDDQIGEIKTQLEKICRERKGFSLKLSGLGAFPDLQSARILWLGVQKTQALLDLQSAIEGGLKMKSEYSYTPHVTIAKLRNLKSVRSVVSSYARQKWGQYYIRDVVLFESIQQGPYTSYRPLAEFQLQPVVDAESE